MFMNSGDAVDMGSLTEPSKYNGHFRSKRVLRQLVRHNSLVDSV